MPSLWAHTTEVDRFRQLSAIFGSYDYQMKGEEYIDQSPWPINWKQNMEGILRCSSPTLPPCSAAFRVPKSSNWGSMSFLKQQELQLEPWRGLPARSAAEQFPNRREDSQRIAIEAWLGLDFLAPFHKRQNFVCFWIFPPPGPRSQCVTMIRRRHPWRGFRNWTDPCSIRDMRLKAHKIKRRT